MKMNQTAIRIAIFIAWLMILMPIYTANAMEIQFNAVQNVDTAADSATIHWTTDEESTGIVRYGTTLLDKDVQSPTPGTSHEVTIENLEPSTGYIYQIVASSPSGSVSVPPTGSLKFTTGSAEDKQAPDEVISLAAPEVKANSVRITWDIDAEVNKDVDSYRIYKNGELIDTIKNKYYVDTDVTAGQAVNYEVSAVDTSGNEGPKKSVSATPGGAAKTITVSDVKAEVMGNNAIISWKTDLPSHSRVRYSTNQLLLDQKKETAESVTEHNITILGLETDKEFFYKVESCDAAGNCGNGSVESFKTGTQTELSMKVDGMDCNPGTATYHNSGLIDITGTASPGADVTIYVNGDKQRYLRVGTTGLFRFGGVRIDTKKTENEIRVVGDDRISKQIECIEKILLDYYGPEVEWSNETKNISVSTQNTLKLSGTLSDNNPVTMRVYVQSLDDSQAPYQVKNLRNTSLEANSVGLEWDKVGTNGTSTATTTTDTGTTATSLEDFAAQLGNTGGDITGAAIVDMTGAQTAATEEDDTFMYLIYRTDVSGGPIATVDANTLTFTDSNVSTSTTYTYQVSAMDKAGNEGPKSEPLTVTTLANGTTVGPRQKVVPEVPTLKHTKEFKTTANTTLKFDEQISGLFTGRNKIKVVFEDIAGNTYEEMFDVTVDSEEPKILSPTSADITSFYSPSYVSEINIEGQANKKTGKVLVYMNVDPKSKDAKPVTTASLEGNGTFSVDVELSTSFSAAISGSFENKTATQASGTVSAKGTPNTIYLVVEDTYGRRSQPVSGQVTYTPCGEGNYFQIEIKPGGNIINTRELLEGVAAYGFGYEAKWQYGQGNATISSINVKQATIGSKAREKYDFDWISGVTVTAPPKNRSTGFVLVGFKPLPVEGKTYLEREKNLSRHRWKECFPYGGCVRLLLEMEINFNSPTLTQQYSSMMKGATSSSQASTFQAPTKQVQCVELKIQLDERLDPSLIPKGLLQGAVTAINATLKVLDTIEKPIRMVAKITLGFCLLSFFSKFAISALRKYYCKYTSTLTSISKGGGGIGNLIKSGKIETIAGWDDGTEEGACTVEFGGDEKAEEAKEACKTCATWIQKEKWIKDKWHLFCDRITCPPVPTLQNYVIQSWGKAGRPSPWRYVDAAAAKITQQCPRNKPLVKDCLCGLKGPQCTANTQYCSKDKCLDVKDCGTLTEMMQGVMSSAEVCSCKTQAGASAFCLRGQVCQSGLCKGTSAQAIGTPATQINLSTVPAEQRACKSAHPTWSCTCSKSECDTLKGKNLCQTGLCTASSVADKYCCAPESERTKAATTSTVPTTLKAPNFSPTYNGFIYTAENSQGTPVALDTVKENGYIWRSKAKADAYKVASKVVIKRQEKENVWYATMANGHILECQCKSYEDAKKILDGQANPTGCTKRTECKGDYKDACKLCQSPGKPVADVIATTTLEEQGGLPDVSDVETGEGMGLITGFSVGNEVTGMQAAKSATTAAKKTTPTPAKKTPTPEKKQATTGKTQKTVGLVTPPKYDKYIKYTKGDYLQTQYVRAKSDCEFAKLGREDVKQMYEQYKDSGSELAKKCSAGHIYQPSCCPWEYMDEWQWGMMFSNEMKLSYCLANPEGEGCKSGASIVTGVTGICTPKGNAKRNRPVILDKLKYKKDYPGSDRLNDQVVYLVDIDEKGTAKSVKKGYFTKAEVKGTVGDVDAQGRVMISTGSYFKPYPANQQDLATAFPKRDNADPSKDQVDFKVGMHQFAYDLCVDIEKGNMVERQKGSTKFKSACKQVGPQPGAKIPAVLEEEYRKIFQLLGEPQRQYLAQPTNFPDALITLCLSAIISWMKHLRNFLTHLQNCLQTIIVTGDGAAGQCRALMSQYICDLLQSVISCIRSRMTGGGGGSRIGTGGIGGVFGAINEASNLVVQDAAARYGNNNLFSNTFAASNIAHDACIFMFTGEWPTDWNALFESAVEMPINTTAIVFPVTRRWQAYDGNTGFARYVYRVAYWVSAGADIQFDLLLSCSGTEKQCPNGEQCDCGYATPQEYAAKQRSPIFLIPRHQSGTCPENGMLKKGQQCTDEILFVSQTPMPLRYDQAILRWKPAAVPAPTGPGGQAVFQGSVVSPESISGQTAGDIREIGSPIAGLCSFSLHDLAFMCGVKIPEKGRATITKMQPARPNNEPFEIGEKAVMDIQVANTLPKDAESCADQCSYTKYLVIDKITNHRNIQIYPPPGKTIVGEKINLNGIQNFKAVESGSFPQTTGSFGAGEFVIKEEDFSSTTQQVTRCTPLSSRGGILRSAVSGKPQCQGGEEAIFRVECNQQGSCWFFRGQRNTKGVYEDTGEKETCESVSGGLTSPIMSIKCAGITMTFDSKKFAAIAKNFRKNTKKTAKNKAESNFHFLMDNQRPMMTTGSATAYQCSATPVEWKMTVSLRDSVESGGGFMMSSGALVDPITNKKQEMTIPFKVVCQGTGRAKSLKKLSDLQTATAKVSAANTIGNKSFGSLWVDEGALGPTEYITVSGFRWVSAKSDQKHLGFFLNINAQVQRETTLNVDVGSIGLIPTENLEVAKTGKAGMQLCSAGAGSPCIESKGDANNRAIKIMLKKGDPEFQFTGFRQAVGLSAVAGTDTVLSTALNTPECCDSGKKICISDIPDTHKDVKVKFTDYYEGTDFFSLKLNTEPAELLDPVTFGIDMKDVYKVQNIKITANGVDVPMCSGGKNPTAYAVLGNDLPYFDYFANLAKNYMFADEEEGMDTITGLSVGNIVTGMEAKTTTSTKKTLTKSVPACSKPPYNAGKANLDSGGICYTGDKTWLIFKTRIGNKVTLNVTGVKRTAFSTVSSLADAGTQIIKLTHDAPKKFGFEAVGLQQEGVINIQSKTTGSLNKPKTLVLNIENTLAGTETGNTVRLIMNLFPMGVLATSGTTVEEAGAAGPLPTCPAPGRACIESLPSGRDADRIIIQMPQIKPAKAFKITGLQTMTKSQAKCRDKSREAVSQEEISCGENQICYVPPIFTTATDCMSKCKVKYIQDQIKAGKIKTSADYAKVVKKGDKDVFCISGSTKCKTYALGGDYCPTGQTCCPDGSAYKPSGPAGPGKLSGFDPRNKNGKKCEGGPIRWVDSKSSLDTWVRYYKQSGGDTSRWDTLYEINTKAIDAASKKEWLNMFKENMLAHSEDNVVAYSISSDNPFSPVGYGTRYNFGYCPKNRECVASDETVPSNLKAGGILGPGVLPGMAVQICKPVQDLCPLVSDAFPDKSPAFVGTTSEYKTISSKFSWTRYLKQKVDPTNFGGSTGIVSTIITVQSVVTGKGKQAIAAAMLDSMFKKKYTLMDSCTGEACSDTACKAAVGIAYSRKAGTGVVASSIKFDNANEKKGFNVLIKGGSIKVEAGQSCSGSGRYGCVCEYKPGKTQYINEGSRCERVCSSKDLEEGDHCICETSSGKAITVTEKKYCCTSGGKTFAVHSKALSSWKTCAACKGITDCRQYGNKKDTCEEDPCDLKSRGFPKGCKYTTSGCIKA